MTVVIHTKKMNSTQLPLVSVIIPIYNAELFLNETLASVLEQSYSYIEIIMVDDNSTDGSYGIALEYQAKNIFVKKNLGKGACAARNYGFKMSTGKYIQYLDADDILSPEKIEQQVHRLEKNPECIAVSDTSHFYDTIDKSAITSNGFLYTTRNVVDFLLKLYGAEGVPNMVQTSAWLTPREIIQSIGPWDENLLKDQDGEFFCRVVLASAGIEYTPNVINYYRKHQTGKNIAALKYREHLNSQFRALESKERQLLQWTDSERFRKAMALQYKWIAVDAWPQYKEISEQALHKVCLYGGSTYLPILGGKIIETIKFILGWKLAKAFSYWVHNNYILQKPINWIRHIK